MSKICKVCNKELPNTDFYPSRKKWTRHTCKQCETKIKLSKTKSTRIKTESLYEKLLKKHYPKESELIGIYRYYRDKGVHISHVSVNKHTNHTI